jgi:hypothetical protein
MMTRCSLSANPHVTGDTVPLPVVLELAVAVVAILYGPTNEWNAGSES